MFHPLSRFVDEPLLLERAKVTFGTIEFHDDIMEDLRAGLSAAGTPQGKG